MNDILTNVDKVYTREDFVEFVISLINDIKNNPADWENRDLISYLGSVASWTEDMEGFYQNNNLQVPNNVSWNVFAEILVAAKIYE